MKLKLVLEPHLPTETPKAATTQLQPTEHNPFFMIHSKIIKYLEIFSKRCGLPLRIPTCNPVPMNENKLKAILKNVDKMLNAMTEQTTYPWIIGPSYSWLNENGK
jgi:hypothetical protein